jgi:outer membrane protein OmpA-like peptidoglycan-associated protein
MKAITAKRVFMFVIAVFSMSLMFGCAHMMDNNGCPAGYAAAPAAAPEPEKVVILASEPRVEEKVMVAAAEPKIIVLAFEDVHFDFDKSTLKPGARTILKRNIQLLKDNPNAHVRIAGYTSASGTEEYNQKLSERRAKAVEEYLISEGIIAPDRLTMIGYGESDPAMYEAAPKELYSKAAKANMRVLFEIVVQ